MSDSVLNFQVNGNNPSVVGGSSTSVLYFPRPYGPSIGVAPSTPSASSAVGALFVPAGGIFNGQQMNVVASGYFGPGAADPSSVATVKLYAVTGSLSSPTYTAIATTPGIADTDLANPWGISATLLGDSESGQLCGSYQAYSLAATTAPTVLAANVAGINFNGDGTGLFGLGNQGLGKGIAFGLVVGVTFTTGNATNTASLTQFQILS